MITIDQASEMGAKGAEPTETEHLLFEAWMRGHCWLVQGDWDGKSYVHESENTGYLHPGAMLTRQLWAAWRDRAALAEQPKFTKHTVEQTSDWSEWVCPDPKGYLMKCCDCGLVHETQFGVVKYKPNSTEDCDMVDDPNLQVIFRMRRNEEQPAPCAPAADGVCEALDCQNHKPAQQEQGDSICQENDGCPTEKAVLQRFWRGKPIPTEHYPAWFKPAQQEPAFYGFMCEEECCVNICYTPSAPGGPNNELPTAYYTSPPAPEWIPVTQELLNAQHPWLYKPMWIAMKGGVVVQGYYEWRQGQKPDRFITDLGNEWAFNADYVMPIVKPEPPAHGIKEGE